MAESSGFMDMSNMSSMFSVDKILILFLFMIVMFVSYYCYSSVKDLRNNIESLKNGSNNSEELPAMIIKNEENITKVSNKLDVFIKYMLGQQVNSQAAQNAKRAPVQMQQDSEEDDDIVVS